MNTSKNRISSPTYSSQQKSLPPVNMRERIVRLTETVNDLRVNVETEAQNQDNLEKSNSKNYTVVSTQIKALKKAFNTLADVIMEELDSIKSEVFRDFQDSNSSIYRKLDELSSQVAKLQNEKEGQKSQAIAVEQDLRDRISILERREEESNELIQSVAETSKDGNRALYEKLNTLIRENSAKIDAITEDQGRLSEVVNDMRRKSNQDSSSIKEIYGKIGDLEEGLRQHTQDLSARITETKNQAGSLKDTVKNEIQVVIKGQTESTRRLEEITSRINERAEANEIAAQKRTAEIEDLLNQVQQEFQENVQELARIHKESSTQIIVDFEKAITSINNDNKVLYKKFAVLEGAVGKTREELGNMISDHEHSISRKNEQLNRAIFDMCRQLNISNPLLSY